MENAHIVKSFDQDLAQIANMVLEMGGLVESQINSSVAALVTRDVELSEKVRKADRAIDSMELQIDEAATRMLALRQPVATDLRGVICALKISANLERIGDYAKNIAKRTGVVVETGNVGSADKAISRMGAMVQQMVRDVLNAFVAKDAEASEEIRMRDEEVDHIHNALFRELLTYMMEDPRNITTSMHLLFIAKNLERMGDHATAIAEQIYYLVNGSLPEEERPKSDVTSMMTIENVSDQQDRK